MEGKPYVLLKGNKAEIKNLPKNPIKLTVKTNSKHSQRVTVKGEGIDYIFFGSGEAKVIGTENITNAPSTITADFVSHSQADGTARPSTLKSGGPYDIGNYNLFVIVAENGDDSDYNDAVFEMSWYTVS